MQVVSGPIGRERVHFEAPPSERIDAEIRKFIKWWQNPPKNLDGLLRAGITKGKILAKAYSNYPE